MPMSHSTTKQCSARRTTSKGEPQKAAALVRDYIARSSDAHVFAHAMLTMALANAGTYDEAMVVAEGLPAAADTTDNPQTRALALNAYAWAYRDADPAAAYDVSRRAMKTALDSGNRFVESQSPLACRGWRPITATPSKPSTTWFSPFATTKTKAAFCCYPARSR